LIGIFIGSDIYTSDFMYKWLPNFSLFHVSIVGLLFLACILVATIFSVISVVKTYKNEKKGIWILSFLALWNLWALVSSIVVIAKFD
jgi:hypothetical protein